MTGRVSGRRGHHGPQITARRSESGVSLVEVLVVLVLVGVMAGAIGLSLGGRGQGAVADREARLMAARITRAADEALLTGTPMAVAWTETGYRVLQLIDGDWGPFDVPLLAGVHALPRGLRLGGRDTVSPFTIGADLMPTGGAPLVLELRGAAGDAADVTFDGATARLAPPV